MQWVGAVVAAVVLFVMTLAGMLLGVAILFAKPAAAPTWPSADRCPLAVIEVYGARGFLGGDWRRWPCGEGTDAVWCAQVVAVREGGPVAVARCTP